MSLAISLDTGDKWIQAGSLYGLALVSLAAGSLDGAEQYALQSMAVSRSTLDEICTVHCLHTLGNVAMARGEFTHARTLLKHALAGCRSHGYKTAQIDVSLSVASFLRRQGEREDALAILRAAQELSEQVGDRRNVAKILLDRASLANEAGAWAEAHACAAGWAD